MSVRAVRNALVETASAPYRPAGRFAWHFARGKLSADPVFTALLARGLIPDAARVLDLGCGQGLLAAWLRAAEQVHARGAWPAQWPGAPRAVRVHGIELMASDVRRAQAALGADADIIRGDVRNAGLPNADVVVILDVLHYLDYAAQEDVLARVRSALAPRGLLLLRVGDADGGLPFRISAWVDRAVTFVRGHRLERLYCRPLAQWRAMLERLGFRVEVLPMSQGTPFANVLLVGRLGSG
jgi:SAM-dependent methyltransferase